MMKNDTTKANIGTKKSTEAGAFTKRIGYTTYRVGVHFSSTSTETARDKIMRLVKNEALAERTAG